MEQIASLFHQNGYTLSSYQKATAIHTLQQLAQLTPIDHSKIIQTLKSTMGIADSRHIEDLLLFSSASDIKNKPKPLPDLLSDALSHLHFALNELQTVLLDSSKNKDRQRIRLLTYLQLFEVGYSYEDKSRSKNPEKQKWYYNITDDALVALSDKNRYRTLDEAACFFIIQKIGACHSFTDFSICFSHAKKFNCPIAERIFLAQLRQLHPDFAAMISFYSVHHPSGFSDDFIRLSFQRLLFTVSSRPTLENHLNSLYQLAYLFRGNHHSAFDYFLQQYIATDTAPAADKGFCYFLLKSPQDFSLKSFFTDHAHHHIIAFLQGATFSDSSFLLEKPIFEWLNNWLCSLDEEDFYRYFFAIQKLTAPCDREKLNEALRPILQ